MKRLLAVGLLVSVVALPILGQEPRKIEQIAARVNNSIILKSDIDRKLDAKRQEVATAVAEKVITAEEGLKFLEKAKDTVLQELIDTALLVQLAKENNLNADLDVLKTMDDLRIEHKFATIEELEKAIRRDYGDLEEFKNTIRESVLSEKVKQHEVYARIVITDEEMRRYYDEHNKDFDKPAGVRLSLIAVIVDKRVPDQMASQRKKMEDALAAIKKGDDFSEVAGKYSELPSSQDGGDLGFFKNGELSEEIEKSIEKMAKNQVSDIVERADAYEIYKITDRHNGGILSFELARQYIGNELLKIAAPPREREFLTKLREEGFVEVKEGFKDTGAVATKPKTRASSKP